MSEYKYPYRNWRPQVRTYKVPRVLFNVLFSYEDLQGDGFIRFTLVALRRGFQLVIPFENRARREFDWSLFPKTVVGGGFFPSTKKTEGT